jgi:uncharacterized NAD-dependent epimerase/dehydratase family protein
VPNKRDLRRNDLYRSNGRLQGGKYGFVFDSTLNDFVSGELEHAIVTCWKEAKPAFILLEGQSALRNQVILQDLSSLFQEMLKGCISPRTQEKIL